jgi:hypothetical protein
MDLSRRVARRLRLIGNTIGLRREKVFAIGFNKTGSSSLHALFESLGRPSFHGVEWRSSARVDLWRRYDCFSDGIPEDFRLLDRLFPGARFILQVRELEPWVYSRLAHIEREKARGGFAGGVAWDDTEAVVRRWLQQRNDYHLEVLEHFQQRAGDLLVVNYTRDDDSATRVARFIGHEVTIQRPERNRKPERPPLDAHRGLLAASAVALGLEPADLRRDLLCRALLPESQRGRHPLDSAELRIRSAVSPPRP